MFFAMIDDDACPNAHALTSCAKSVTILSDRTTSTVTLEPQSLLTLVAVLLGFLVGQYVKYLQPIQLFYYYKRRLTLHIL